MAAILVLMAVISQHWGSHKIQGATKEREPPSTLSAIKMYDRIWWPILIRELNILGPTYLT